MTPPKVLDERSLKEREQHIINSAIEQISVEGIENLTMDKVIARVPYSKGTVYKHFTGKEDLFVAISNQALGVLSGLFYRAYDYNSCTRERMLLLNFSYLIYAILHPGLFQSVICARTVNIVAKASKKRVEEQEALEYRLISSLHTIVEEGINEGSLTLQPHMNVQQTCFANWSMGYGVISLLSNEVEECSEHIDLIVERELFNYSNLLFDGLGWLPLSKNSASGENLVVALNTVFPDELQQMKENGRELKLF